MENYTKYPWGHSLIWADTKDYRARMFVVLEGLKTPYIYHKKMDITVYVLQGMVKMVIEGQHKMLQAGDKYHIPANHMHCFVAIKNDAVLLESGSGGCMDDIVEVEK